MLDAWEAEQARKARVRKLGAAAVAVALVGGFLALVERVNNPPPTDERDRFTDIAPFTEFNAVAGAGWVARVDATWPGLTDTSVADAACAALTLRLAPKGDETITILGPDGLPARECEARLQ